MIIRALAILLLTAASAFALTQQITDTVPAREPLTDYAIKDLIVQDSVDAYPGMCPCPYSKHPDGATCVGRSAIEKPDGLTPMCYPTDVAPYMIEGYRMKHNIPKP
jgi:hypothetical protein